jgi:hypothetical protein
VLPPKFGVSPIQGPFHEAAPTQIARAHLWELAHLVPRSVPACQSDVPLLPN